VNIFKTPLPNDKNRHISWGNLHGCAHSLAIAEAVKKHDGLVVVITPDSLSAIQLEYELRFFLGTESLYPILHFPDWETLPYDSFSPHQDIISQRLATLNRLPNTDKGVLICPVNTLMNRIAPVDYLQGSSFLLDLNDKLNPEKLRRQLQAAGYHCVEQVYEHGEFAIRGSIIDLFPMGCDTPFRIELFDDEIETIRSFDPETQRSIEKLEKIELLPAREVPLNEDAITQFRTNWRNKFHGNPMECAIYQDISDGLASPGVEYFISLFFESTANLIDYLPKNSLLISFENIYDKATEFWTEVEKRHEQLRHDVIRPILLPIESFTPTNDLFAQLKPFAQIKLYRESLDKNPGHFNFDTASMPELDIKHKAKVPLQSLKDYLSETDHRVLFCAETTGRREALLALFKDIQLKPTQINTWQEFLDNDLKTGITVFPLDQPLNCVDEKITIITEPQLFGQRILQRRRRKQEKTKLDTMIHDLAELRINDPVVHIDHGVGRYLGLKNMVLNDYADEYLILEYANDATLYVPVSSLHLISRYSGTDIDHAPLHKLGSDQWQRAKRKAALKVRDAAVELLDIYARRAAQKGVAFKKEENYQLFSEGFLFEETPDQLTAIEQTIADMQSEKSMDRLICGDVGFGKTEVAMRAAFIAAINGKQTAILAPTTLLAQQHYESFKDRFADWPVEIDVLSRFRTAKEQKNILERLKDGKIDIIIGTHKLLGKDIKFSSLGLLVIDEEHRFGVKQKEILKSMRANVDILTLTATPIPRTLNMAFSGIRDLSIIATPPAKRLAIKTFVQKSNKSIVREAILREILRGGQVYFLHNKVDTIDRAAEELQKLVPEARINIGHGQMRERDLEQTMADFYHRRFNVLVCTTIIETGIDVASANTIIINRADKFGVAQLHQLRGRVGRSHHQAYAYLLIPDQAAITKDAKKRLEAIATHEDLGVGFMLATHDLEIRGAGEFLGDEQSGQMQEIGFSLYMDMLERAVKALKAGEAINLEQPLQHGAEIDLKISTIIPEDYLPDIHSRLMLYKRIASAKDKSNLHELEVEMIDRFGLLPDSVKHLFSITQLKLQAEAIGIKKLESGNKAGRICFSEKLNIDPIRIVKLLQNRPNEFRLDGPDKLRFKLNESNTPEARIAAVEDILSALQ